LPLTFATALAFKYEFASEPTLKKQARASRAMSNYLPTSGTMNMTKRTLRIPTRNNSIFLRQNVATLLADVGLLSLRHLFIQNTFILKEINVSQILYKPLRIPCARVACAVNIF